MGIKIPMGRGNYEGEDANMPGQRSHVNCAKRLNQIEMPFALWTRVGPKKYVLDGAQILHSKGAIIMGKDMPGHARRHCAVSCATRAQQ